MGWQRWYSVVTSQGHQLDLELGLLSVWIFECSPCVHVGFTRVIQFPPTSQNHAPRCE